MESSDEILGAPVSGIKYIFMADGGFDVPLPSADALVRIVPAGSRNPDVDPW
jgi:hypothetical protein